MNSCISKLGDECLELIFIHSEGNPWILSTISKVCRRWYNISQRPSVWHILKIEITPCKHKAYATFLSSEYKKEQLKSVKYLCISRSTETRHTHPKSLPLKALTGIRHVETSNLCLAEIGHLSQKLELITSGIESMASDNIEAWCSTRQFSIDLFTAHSNLQQVCFHFNQDGHSGFASIHNAPASMLPVLKDIKSLVLTSVRDDEDMDQHDVLEKMQMVETNMDEVFSQEQIQLVEQQKSSLLQVWNDIEHRLLKKYTYFTNVKKLERLEFGFCYAWTPTMWRNFRSLAECNPNLKHLGLHGWNQLGKLVKFASTSSTFLPIRADAESAIAECFDAMPNLVTVRLVDFAIGPGLFTAGRHVAKSICSIDIIFSKYFLQYLREQADIWHLIGPIKEFVQLSFAERCFPDKARSCSVFLHPDLLERVNSSIFFEKEPLIDMLQSAVKDKNVNVKLSEHIYA